MTTFVLLLVYATALQPIVQTYDAKSCATARKALARVIRDGELVCVPGALVMPMDGMR